MHKMIVFLIFIGLTPLLFAQTNSADQPTPQITSSVEAATPQSTSLPSVNTKPVKQQSKFNLFFGKVSDFFKQKFSNGKKSVETAKKTHEENNEIVDAAYSEDFKSRKPTYFTNQPSQKDAAKLQKQVNEINALQDKKLEQIPAD